MIFIILLLLSLLVFIWTFQHNRTPKRVPKLYRFSFPILGHIPYLFWTNSELFQDVLMEFKGDGIMTFDIFMTRVVLVNDAKLIKEIMASKSATGRGLDDNPLLKIRSNGTVRGMLFTSGNEWKEQRTFAMKELRHFGLGQKSLENQFIHEAMELTHNISEQVGKPISTKTLFSAAVLNSLWIIATGERLQLDCDEITKLFNAVNIFTGSNTTKPYKQLVFSFFPIISKIAPELSGWNELKEQGDIVRSFLRSYVHKTMESYQGNYPEHFTHTFIDKIRSTEDPNSSFFGKRGEETLIAVLSDIFDAGSEALNTSMQWICLYLALNPRIQNKLHQEIDSVVGNNSPSLSDRKRMLYSEAFLLEILRCSNTIFGVPHSAIEDVHIGNHLIPKGTMIFTNIHATHFEKSVWGDPHTFRPERFLNDDESELIMTNSMMPFGSGKRACIGENLSRNQLFLFTVCIFQKLIVSVVPNETLPTTKPDCGLISYPKPHKLIFHKRLR